MTAKFAELWNAARRMTDLMDDSFCSARGMTEIYHAMKAISPEEIRMADEASALVAAAILIQRAAPESLGKDWLSLTVKRSEWSEFLAAIGAIQEGGKIQTWRKQDTSHVDMSGRIKYVYQAADHCPAPGWELAPLTEAWECRPREEFKHKPPKAKP